MVTYNNKEYTNFADFAKCYKNRYSKIDFLVVDYHLNVDVDDLTKEHVKSSGVYEIEDKKFFITTPFEGDYCEISENGNEKHCRNSLQILVLEHPNKKGETILKINDASQLKRTIGAMLGKNPSGIKCKAQKSKIDADVIRAKFADFEEFCCQIGYFLPNVDVDDAIAKFTEKQQEEQKANEIDNIVKKMNVSIDVAEKIYNAMNA